VTKSQYLKPGKLSYLEDNMGSTYRSQLIETAQAASDRKGVRRTRKAVNKWTAIRGSQQQRASPFLEFAGCDSTDFIRYRYRHCIAMLRAGAGLSRSIWSYPLSLRLKDLLYDTNIFT